MYRAEKSGLILPDWRSIQIINGIMQRKELSTGTIADLQKIPIIRGTM